MTDLTDLKQAGLGDAPRSSGAARTAAATARTNCGVDGCEKLSHSQGFCLTHYRLWRMINDPVIRQDAQTDDKLRRGVCKIDGCEAANYRLGFCQAHYLAMRHYGDPLATAPAVDETPDPAIKRQPEIRRCAAPGCQLAARKMGWCAIHYQREYRRRQRENAEATHADKVESGVVAADGGGGADAFPSSELELVAGSFGNWRIQVGLPVHLPPEERAQSRGTCDARRPPLDSASSAVSQQLTGSPAMAPTEDAQDELILLEDGRTVRAPELTFHTCLKRPAAG